jgi:hypothetical protein
MAVLALSASLTLGDAAQGSEHFESFREEIMESGEIDELGLLFRYAEMVGDKPTEKRCYLKLEARAGETRAGRIFNTW